MGEGLEFVYGRPSKEVTFDIWKSFVHDDDRDRIINLIKTAAENRTPYEGEFRVIWPDGSVHWVLVRGHVAWKSGRRAVDSASFERHRIRAARFRQAPSIPHPRLNRSFHSTQNASHRLQFISQISAQ